MRARSGGGKAERREVQEQNPKLMKLYERSDSNVKKEKGYRTGNCKLEKEREEEEEDKAGEKHESLFS